MIMLDTTSQFEKLWTLGYHRLVPIIPPGAPISAKSTLFKRLQKGDDARGKMPGVKWPDGTWSGFDFVRHESEPHDLAKWAGMGAGVGIKTGSGLVLVDADTINPEWADTIKRAIEDANLILPIRIGRAPKVGYLVRTDPDFKYTMFEFGPRRADGKRDRIEILAEGKQFVAEGIHPGTMLPYKWPQGVPALDTVPFADTASLMAIMDYLRAHLPDVGPLQQDGGTGAEYDQDAFKGPFDLVERAVAMTPNTLERFPSRESYLQYGYAIKAATGEDGWPLFFDWSQRWADGENDPDIVRADWDRMKPPFRLGASWLYEKAEQATGTSIAAEQWYEPESVMGEALFPEDKSDPKPKRSFQFVSFDDAASRATTALQRPLVKGLLDWGAMTILYGPSNVGKTFVTMDLAFHVAAGLPFGGMRTEGGAVVYVAAEGGRGVYARVAALKTRYGAAAEGVRFEILPMSVDLRRRDADLSPLIAAVKAIDVPVALIVVDTLSRALAGGDENSSVDMGNIVTHFDMLRQETEAHLLVVHHTGKNLANGARGHSLLRAATDTEIEISDGLFEVTKQRDLPKNWTTGFALDVVRLGADADGDDITSCVVRLVGRDEVDVAGLSPKEVVVLRAVSELDAFADGSGEGDGGIGLADVEDYLARSADKLSKDIIRHSLRSLSAKGAIRKSGRGKWGLNRQNVDWRDPIFTKRDTSCIGESGEESSPNAFE